MHVLARLLFLNKMASEVRTLRDQEINHRKRNRCGEKFRKIGQILCCSHQKDDEESCNEKLANHSFDNASRDMTGISGLEIQMAELRKAVQRMEMKMEERRSRQHSEYVTALEWRSIASVLDRLFFVVYVVLITISLVVFFPKPKQEFQHGEH